MLGRESGQLVEVGREERAAAHARREMLRDGPREPEAVVCRRAAPELVDEHQRALRRSFEDGRRLEHLRHEGRDAARLAVARAHAREDRVGDRYLGRVARHERAHLREQHVDARRADVGALAAHVGPCDDLKGTLASHEHDVILDEAHPIHALDAWVAAAAEHHALPAVLGWHECRLDERLGRRGRHVREGKQHVELREQRVALDDDRHEGARCVDHLAR